MIHYKTKNLSALKMYSILKNMGVDNNAFFLTLYDEKLQDVDPLDEDNLTEDQKYRIHREITRNPYYFIREIVRIPAAGLVLFEFNRGNLAICWAALTNLRFISLLPRQCYKTFTVAALIVWFIYWGAKHSEIMQLTYDQGLAKNNTNRIKLIRDHLPSYLKLHSSRIDVDNSEEIKYKQLNNKYFYKIGPKNTDDATRAGRGFSIPIYWIDEIFFVNNIQIIYDVSMFAHNTASQRATEMGLPTTLMATTTAGYLNTEEGRWGFNQLNSAAVFSEKMYDMPIEDIREIISTNSKNRLLRIEFMYYDLGKGDNYLAEQKETSTDQDAFDRDVLNMWKDTDVNHPLGQDLVARLIMCKKQPKDAILLDRIYMLVLYRKISELDQNLKYILGMDTSGNVGGDFTTLVITDPTNFEVVGVMRTNSHRTTRFGRVVAAIMLRLLPNSILVPERNNMGSTVADGICDAHPGLKSRIYVAEDEKLGMNTNAKTRSQMFDEILKSAVENDMDRINDVNIISEVTTLHRTRSGRIDHKPGYHDDTLVGYLITRWFLIYGYKIDRYIRPTIVGSKLTSEERLNAVKPKYLKDPMNDINANTLNASIGLDNSMYPGGELLSHSSDRNSLISSMDRITDDFYRAVNKGAVELEIETIDPDSDDDYGDDPDPIKRDQARFLRTEKETERFFKSKRKNKDIEKDDLPVKSSLTDDEIRDIRLMMDSTTKW